MANSILSLKNQIYLVILHLQFNHYKQSPIMTTPKTLMLITAYLLTFLPLQSQEIHTPVTFSATVEKVNHRQVQIVIAGTIDNGWYLYGTTLPEGGPLPTTLKLQASSSFKTVGKLKEITPTKEKVDEMFEMKVQYFAEKCKIGQVLEIVNYEPFTVSGTLEYQACDNRNCVAASYDFSVTVDPKKLNLSAQSTQGVDTVNTTSLQDTVTLISQPATPVDSGADESLWWFFAIALLAGFGGVFTPCVFPMIPMTIAFFINPQQNKKTGLAKSLIFGLSIMLIYTSVGVIAGLSKNADPTGSIVTHWIPNFLFFALFIVFVISFLGAFEITLPSWLSNSIDKQADKGGYLAAFFVALALVVISFSCTGPFVGSLLVAAAGGSMIKPIIGMFGFGLAFALPFFVLSLSPSLLKKMPKSGGWLNSIKVVFAVILLAVSIKFFNTATLSLFGEEWISFEVTLSVWIALSCLLGFYLLGKIKLSHDTETKHIGAFRFLLVLASFSLAVYLYAGLMGRADVGIFSGLLPLQKENTALEVPANAATPAPSPCGDAVKYSGARMKTPQGIQGYLEIRQALDCAKSQNKPILIDFTGHGCSSCKKMEKTVFADPRVTDFINQNYVMVSLYTDDRTLLPEQEWKTSTSDNKVKKTIGEQNKDYQISRYKVNATPYFVIIDSNENLKTTPVGYTDSTEEFLKFLQSGI